MELDKRLGPAPADEMEEALADRARANKRIRELRREGKTNSVQSGVADPAAPVPSAGHEQRAEPRHAKRRRNDRGTDVVQLTLETLTQPEPKKRGAADGHEPGGEKEMKVGGASVNTPVEKPARKKRDSADACCNPTDEPPTIYEQALKWGEEWHARSRSR